jgi:hypothetical protein
MSTVLVVAVGVQMFLAASAINGALSTSKYLASFALHKDRGRQGEAETSLDEAEIAMRWARRYMVAWMLSCVVVACLWLLQ